MLEWLNQIDTALFRFFNGMLANPVTDLVMPIVTNDNLLRGMFAVAVILLLWKGDSRYRWLVLFAGLTVLITDQMSSHVLKPLLARPRPCHTLIDIRLLVPCGGGLSLPSSHAANAFGQAALFGLAWPKGKWWLVGAASVIALSRIFVGVHYPFDILGGAVVGLLCGGLVFICFRVSIGRRLRTARTPTVGEEG